MATTGARTIIDVGASTTRMERDISAAIRNIEKRGIEFKVPRNQPLGRITSDLNEFTKSLEASNARVIAFGASASIIAGFGAALKDLVGSAIQVEKAFADINVIMNASTSQLNKFSKDLFNVAAATGQGFDKASVAATELSRQGLGAVETLSRLNAALVLSRLSGLDTADSVNAVTAAVNSFINSGVTAVEVVNKLAAVDASYAVSSADLANAISRVGSSASDAGVSLDELIGLVTSAQQTTARGGAVIGNSLKTIFTRLQRGKVVDLLESLGISTEDGTGELRSTVDLLAELARTYDTVGQSQKAYIAEQVGGVFQINILKALLNDLNNQFSVFEGAKKKAGESGNSAFERNAELNKTIAAQVNELILRFQQLGDTLGKSGAGDAIKNILATVNSIITGISGLLDQDNESSGAKLAQGLVKGIADYLTGPGLAIIGGLGIKLFADFGKFAGGALGQLLGLDKQAQLQKTIQGILQQNPQILDQIINKETTLLNVQTQLLNLTRQQTAEMQKRSQIATALAGRLGGQIGVGSNGLQTSRTGLASGYVANFSEQAMIEAGAYGTPKSAQVRNGTIRPLGQIQYNTSEEIVRNFPHKGVDAVLPKNQKRAQETFRRFGYASGYIPNFADGKQPKRLSGRGRFEKRVAQGLGLGNSFDFTPNEDTYMLTGQGGPNSGAQDLAIRSLFSEIGAKDGPTFFQNLSEADRSLLKSNGSTFGARIKYAGLGKPTDFEDMIDDYFTSSFKKLANDVAGGLRPGFDANIGNFTNFLTDSSFPTLAGNLFEAVVDSIQGTSRESGGGIFDYPSISSTVKDLFNLPESAVGKKGEAKGRLSESAEKSMLGKLFTLPEVSDKFRKQLGALRGGKQGLASGYVANFAAVQDAIQREVNAGVNPNDVRVGYDSRIGLGVYNTKDEPRGLGQGIDRVRKQGGNPKKSGMVPNFFDPLAILGSFGLGGGGGESDLRSLTAELNELQTKITKNSAEIAKATPSYVRLKDALEKTQRSIDSQRAAGARPEDFSNETRRAGKLRSRLSKFGSLQEEKFGLAERRIGAERSIADIQSRRGVGGQFRRGGPGALTAFGVQAAGGAITSALGDNGLSRGISSAGNIASTALTAGTFGGPPAALIAGLAAAALELDKFVASVESSTGKYSKAVNDQKVSLEALNSQITSVLNSKNSIEALQNKIRNSQQVSPEDLRNSAKAERGFLEQTRGFKPEVRDSLLNAKSSEEVASILEQQRQIQEKQLNINQELLQISQGTDKGRGFLGTGLGGDSSGASADRVSGGKGIAKEIFATLIQSGEGAVQKIIGDIGKGQPIADSRFGPGVLDATLGKRNSDVRSAIQVELETLLKNYREDNALLEQQQAINKASFERIKKMNDILKREEKARKDLEVALQAQAADAISRSKNASASRQFNRERGQSSRSFLSEFASSRGKEGFGNQNAISRFFSERETINSSGRDKTAEAFKTALEDPIETLKKKFEELGENGSTADKINSQVRLRDLSVIQSKIDSLAGSSNPSSDVSGILKELNSLSERTGNSSQVDANTRAISAAQKEGNRIAAEQVRLLAEAKAIALEELAQNRAQSLNKNRANLFGGFDQNFVNPQDNEGFDQVTKALTNLFTLNKTAPTLSSQRPKSLDNNIAREQASLVQGLNKLLGGGILGKDDKTAKFIADEQRKVLIQQTKDLRTNLKVTGAPKDVIAGVERKLAQLQDPKFNLSALTQTFEALDVEGREKLVYDETVKQTAYLKTIADGVGFLDRDNTNVPGSPTQVKTQPPAGQNKAQGEAEFLTKVTGQVERIVGAVDKLTNAGSDEKRDSSKTNSPASSASPTVTIQKNLDVDISISSLASKAESPNGEYVTQEEFDAVVRKLEDIVRKPLKSAKVVGNK